MIIFQFSISEVVPSNGQHNKSMKKVIRMVDIRACIAVKECRGFDRLPTILTSFAFESVMSITNCVLLKREELA